MVFSRWFVLAVSAGMLLLSAEPAFSEGEISKTMEERVQDLDQKVRILERKLEIEQEKGAEKAKEAPGVVSGKEGFFLKSADGQFQLRFRGLIHVDARFLKPDTDTFLLRRVRPILEGTVYNLFDFRFTPDFGGGQTVIQDAFLNIRFHPSLKLQLGKYKPPVGLERLQSASDIRFVERALPTNLVPNRDIGVQLHGDLAEERVAYAVGVFNGAPDNSGSVDADRDENKEVAGRIFLQPFKKSALEPVQGLGLGVAGTYGKTVGVTSANNLPSYRTPGQATFYAYRATTLADGTLLRTAPQAYYYWGPFGLIGEYVLSSQEVIQAGTSARINNRAWQVAGSYLLTGEKNGYRGVTPFRPFDAELGRWGAFEVKGRYSLLEVDEEAFPIFADPATGAREAKAWAAGFNWYLNRGVKFVLDYESTKFQGGAASGDRENERAILGRTQIAF